MPERKRLIIDDACAVTAIKDDRFRTGIVTVDMYLPYDEEKAAARCIVPNLLIRADRQHPDYTSLRRRLAQLYGASLRASSSMFGDWHKLTVGIVFMDDRYAMNGDKVADECTRLLLGMLFDPLLENGCFRSEDAENERRLLIERIDAQKNDKIRYARMQCIKNMCAEEPYGKESYGSREQVERMTTAQMAQAWRETVKTARFEITASGSFDSESVARIIGEELAKADRNPAVLPEQIIIGKASEVRFVTERMDVKQAKLVTGWRTPINAENGDYTAAKIAAIILGGIPNSLLFSNVREKLSLCYYCSSSYIRLKGMMLIQSGVEEENAQKAREAINEQFGALCRGDFTDELVQQAKIAVISACREINDSVMSLAEWYSSQAFDSKIQSPEEYIEEIGEVTKERIVAAAKTFTEDTVYLLTGKEEL